MQPIWPLYCVSGETIAFGTFWYESYLVEWWNDILCKLLSHHRDCDITICHNGNSDFVLNYKKSPNVWYLMELCCLGDVTMCYRVGAWRYFMWLCSLQLQELSLTHDVDGTVIFWNIRYYSPSDTASHPGRHRSSATCCGNLNSWITSWLWDVRGLGWRSG